MLSLSALPSPHLGHLPSWIYNIFFHPNCRSSFLIWLTFFFSVFFWHHFSYQAKAASIHGLNNNNSSADEGEGGRGDFLGRKSLNLRLASEGGVGMGNKSNYVV